MMNTTNRSQTNWMPFLMMALFWVAGSAFVGIYGVDWFMPVAASAEAEAVDGLFRFMLIIATFIFLMVETLMIYFAIKYGLMRDKNDDSDGEPIHGNAQLEIIWTIIPSIIVFIVTIYSFQVLVDTTEAKNDELAIDVVGQRFFWQFTYPDENPDDEIDPISQNHVLVLPQNRNVVLNMNSIDVIHAFWVPAFRVKNDVMPARTTELRFTPTELTGLPPDFQLVTEEELDIPGPDTACPVEEATATTSEAAAEPEVARAIEGTTREVPPVDYSNGHDIVCAELCGGNHGLMRGEVFVVTPEEYEAYLETLMALDKQASAQQAYAIRCGGEQIKVAGRQLVGPDGYNCTSCHMLPDAGQNAMGAGPSWIGIGTRAATQHTDYASAEDYLLTSIINPNAHIVEGYAAGIMPQNYADIMSEEDLNLIVAYLALQTD
jgi:cytochrome c oxidase subunit 2